MVLLLIKGQSCFMYMITIHHMCRQQLITADALLVSRCDLNCSKKLFITLKVLHEWSMNAIDASLLNNLFNCVNTITDMLLKSTTISVSLLKYKSTCMYKRVGRSINQYLCYWCCSNMKYIICSILLCNSLHNINLWLHYKTCFAHPSVTCTQGQLLLHH